MMIASSYVSAAENVVGFHGDTAIAALKGMGFVSGLKPIAYRGSIERSMLDCTFYIVGYNRSGTVSDIHVHVAVLPIFCKMLGLEVRDAAYINTVTKDYEQQCTKIGNCICYHQDRRLHDLKITCGLKTAAEQWLACTFEEDLVDRLLALLTVEMTKFDLRMNQLIMQGTTKTAALQKATTTAEEVNPLCL